MTDRNNFTPDEWKLIMQSPMIAGIAVSAAEPSGLWGTLKEFFAAGGALARAATDANANSLVKAVATGFTSADGNAARDGLKAKLAGSQPADIKVKSIETLRQVSALIDAKAPGDGRGLQGLVAPNQRAHCRSGGRGRHARIRRCSGERSREGDAC